MTIYYLLDVAGTVRDHDYLQITEEIRRPTIIKATLSQDVEIAKANVVKIYRDTNYPPSQIVSKIYRKGLVTKPTYQKAASKWQTSFDALDDFGYLFHEVLKATTYTALKPSTIFNTMFAGDGDPNPSAVTTGTIDDLNVDHTYYGSANADSNIEFTTTTTRFAQTFLAPYYLLNTANLWAKKVGNPTGNLTAKLYAATGTIGTDAVPTGAALATSGTVAASSLTTSYAWITFTFATPYALTFGNKYAISFEHPNSTGTDYVGLRADDSSPTHPGNAAYYTTSWLDSLTYDLIFYLNNETEGVTISPDIQTRGQFMLDFAERLRAEIAMRTTDGSDKVLDFQHNLGSDKTTSVRLDDDTLAPPFTIDDGDWLLETNKIYAIGGGSPRAEEIVGTGSKISVAMFREITDAPTLENIGNQLVDTQATVKTLECRLKGEDTWGLNLGDTVLVTLSGRTMLQDQSMRIVKLQRIHTPSTGERVRLWLANTVWFELERHYALKIRALEEAVKSL